MEESIQYIECLDKEIKVLIHPAEEGGFWAECPELPGCITEGENKEEITANIKEIIEALTIIKNKV